MNAPGIEIEGLPLRNKGASAPPWVLSEIEKKVLKSYKEVVLSSPRKRGNLEIPGVLEDKSRRKRTEYFARLSGESGVECQDQARSRALII